jgi:membrane protease YdiL (CAAX protease family)
MQNKAQSESLTAKHTLSPLASVVCLIIGLVVSVEVRILVSGIDGARSAAAGLIFGSCILILALSYARLNFKINSKVVLLGLLGAGVVCLPVVAKSWTGASAHPAGNYLSWAVIVSAVAVAEEIFFRGALYQAISRWKGQTAAILGAALAFGFMHVPFYGWHVLPLDLVVGVWLGILRYTSKSITAPAITHALADLIGWFI